MVVEYNICWSDSAQFEIDCDARKIAFCYSVLLTVISGLQYIISDVLCFVVCNGAALPFYVTLWCQRCFFCVFYPFA